MVTAFSQRDPRWAEEMLGSCNELTIGKAGCLISSVASMLVDWEVQTDPYRLNEWLRHHWGYVDGCRFVFKSAGGLGAELVEVIRCPHTPAPVDWLGQALADGCGVVAIVDAAPGGAIQQHWVRMIDTGIRREGDTETWRRGDAEIMDPWQEPGSEMVGLLEKYGAPKWDLARAIMGAAIYRRNGARVIRFVNGAGEAQEIFGLR